MRGALEQIVTHPFGYRLGRTPLHLVTRDPFPFFEPTGFPPGLLKRSRRLPAPDFTAIAGLLSYTFFAARAAVSCNFKSPASQPVLRFHKPGVSARVAGRPILEITEANP